MYQTITKSLMVLMMVVCLIVTPMLARAETSYPPPATSADVPAEAILADVLLLRPFGFAATLLGTAVFIVSLPLSLPTRSVNTVANKLVVEPAKYTFVRPIGQIGAMLVEGEPIAKSGTP
jgi:hypothetical protein